MNGQLRFTGEMPVFSLKLEWVPGQTRELSEIKRHVSESFKKELTTESQFIDWLNDFIADKDFFIEQARAELDTSEGTDSLEDKPAGKGRGKGKVKVESQSLKTSASMAEAKDRLRKMRHPDEVGVIERNKDVATTFIKQPKDTIAEMRASSSKVLTGDQLQDSVPRKTGKPNVHALSDQGEHVVKIPTSKEEQAKVTSKMSGLSSQSHVLNPENLEGTHDITGGDEQSTAKDKKPRSEISTKRNRYFQTEPGSASRLEVTIDHLISEKDPKELTRLIGFSSDKSVLRMAKVFHSDNGNTAVVNALNKRIKELSKF